MLFTVLATMVGTSLVTWWVLRRRASRRGQAAVDRTAEVGSMLTEAAERLRGQEAETEAARRRGDEYFRAAAGLVKEATSARELYVTSAAQHAAAQAMLLRELDRVTQQYAARSAEYQRATGKPLAPLAVTPVVRQVVQAFQDEHVVGPAAGAPPGRLEGPGSLRAAERREPADPAQTAPLDAGKP